MADSSASLIGSAFGDFGAAASDLFTAQGEEAAATSYGQAAKLAQQNVSLEKESTAIQETQLSRSIMKTQGAAEAEAGGNGLANEGSVTNILRSSASQGALAKALVGVQGIMNENSYAEQAGALTSEQQQATSAAKGSTAGGALSAIAGVASVAALFL